MHHGYYSNEIEKWHAGRYSAESSSEELSVILQHHTSVELNSNMVSLAKLNVAMPKLRQISCAAYVRSSLVE